MSRGTTADLDLMGIFEALWIAVGGDDAEDNALAPADVAAVEVYVCSCGAEEDTYETGVAEKFFDGLAHQFWLPVQESPLLRVLEESEPCIAQDGGHGLREGDEGRTAQ